MSKILVLLALLAQDEASARSRKAVADLLPNGTLAIAGEAVGWDALAATLKRHRERGVRELALRADGSVPFSNVQNLMAAAKEAGIESVQFSSDKPLPPVKFSDGAHKSLRIKVREGARGLEILVLQESAVPSVDELRRQLKGLEKIPVVIDADYEVPYGAVKQIVGACTEEGFEKVSFAGSPRRGGGSVRVLYAEAVPRYEFRYLRNMMERSTEFKLDVFLATADPGFPGSLAAFPKDLSAYDVVLMGGLKELDEGGKKALVDFVGRGGGIVWMAAELPTESWIGNEIESTCPVKLAAPAERPLFPPSLRLDVREPKHALTEGLNWRDMSGKNHTLWAVEKLDPDARVLVEARPAGQATSQPFLVTQTLGRGRALFIGALDTFEWRRETGDQPHFAPFWTNVLKWAATGK